jgi:hypothetical protein
MNDIMLAIKFKNLSSLSSSFFCCSSSHFILFFSISSYRAVLSSCNSRKRSNIAVVAFSALSDLLTFLFFALPAGLLSSDPTDSVDVAVTGVGVDDDEAEDDDPIEGVISETATGVTGLSELSDTGG